MRITGRLPLVTALAGLIVLLSAGIAHAEGTGSGGDGGHGSASGARSGDRGSHHRNDAGHPASRADRNCCERGDESIEYECSDGGLQDLPGFGAVPVDIASGTCDDD